LVTLTLSIACATLAVMWPGWLTAFRAEGYYDTSRQAANASNQAASLGTVAITTTGVQTTNIGLRLNALRAGAQA
jgi:hypothetical protein